MPVKLFVLAFLFGVLCEAKTACRIYVQPISVVTTYGDRPIRDRIVERITASGKCKVVTQVELADAVLSGTGWVNPGQANPSPGARSEAGDAVLQVRLKSPAGKILWSASVTPRWLPLSHTRNLADQAVRRLLAAQPKWSRP
jgi:hypothetical protein